jgi:hypothetical protein
MVYFLTAYQYPKSRCYLRHEKYVVTQRSLSPDGSDEISFTRSIIHRLISILEFRPLPRLSSNEQAHLIVLIQTTLEVGGQHDQGESHLFLS